jgi:acetyl coenzyme A synthetase (ADP forming)-like protein
MTALNKSITHLEGDVVLRDGSTVRVRQIRPDDEQRLLEFYRGLSKESRWLRFFSPISDAVLESQAHRDVTAQSGTFGLVASTGPGERLVGHALFATLPAEPGRVSDHAEVAFAIADDFQGRGLATILLGQLAEVASRNGITTFEAETLAANHRMLGVFRHSGFHVKVSVETGQLHVTFPTSLTAEAIDKFEQREWTAAVNALRLFLHPRSVAVIGASRSAGTIGGEIFRNLISYGFQGPVYPVNPSAEVVQSVMAYPSIEAISGPVDLAVIVVPASLVVKAAEECGRKGVRALVVISAEFAEVGEEGRERQAELVRVCRETGMRLIGPNCMGIINTDPDVRLDATFAPILPTAGRVGFSSQSGALGLAVIDYASSLGLGISSFVSVGNKADISGNDLLRYWDSDSGTDVILLYLESFGRPRKFSQIARKVGRNKPIVVVKSGRSAAGARATSSHTGALLAASDVTVDALFRQAGVIRTDTLEELFDVASLLANQPLPGGPRVGIITNAGGPAILCADACESRGLEVPVLEESTRNRLREILAPGATPTNPVDMIASATAEQYRETMRLVAADPNIDSLIVIFTPPLVTRAEAVGEAIIEVARESNRSKPLLAVFMTSQGAPEVIKSSEIRIPSYAFPETAAIALARAAQYRGWRERPIVEPPQFQDIRRDEAAAIVANALAQGIGWLGMNETRDLLSCYALPLAEQRLVSTPEEAGLAAEELQGPVALKAIAPGLLHKTEAGAVRLNLQDRDQVAAAARELSGKLTAIKAAANAPLAASPLQFLVQRMVTGGVEMLVGVVHDRHFGPIVACGAGGVMVELLRDVSVQLTPLNRQDADDMIRSLKTFPLLTGFRGSPPCDVEALIDGLLRVSAMVEDLPQIAELDCNPFLVLEQGAAIVDARVRIEAVEPRSPIGTR